MMFEIPDWPEDLTSATVASGSREDPPAASKKKRKGAKSETNSMVKKKTGSGAMITTTESFEAPIQSGRRHSEIDPTPAMTKAMKSKKKKQHIDDTNVIVKSLVFKSDKKRKSKKVSEPSTFEEKQEVQVDSVSLVKKKKLKKQKKGKVNDLASEKVENVNKVESDRSGTDGRDTEEKEPKQAFAESKSRKKKKKGVKKELNLSSATAADNERGDLKETYQDEIQSVSNGSKRKQPTAGPEPKRPKMALPSYADSLREKLASARFRFVNEQLYTSSSAESQTLFKEDPEAFEVYHQGFQFQVAKWPSNPLDVIIDHIKKLPKGVVADFGCGDARLAQTVTDRKVHSFDFVAHNKWVTACDMAHTPLKNGSVQIAVFCLSLMGTNLAEFILEANRVLSAGGHLFIAEVTSRCNDIDGFLRALEKFGFKLQDKNTENSHFFFAKFVKSTNVTGKAKLPKIYLKPCMYKKR